MKITYKHGDVLKATERFILQGCNAQGVMGSGVAKLIRDKHPEVFTEYRATYERQGNRLFLGQTIWVPTGEHTFINGITQEHYGRDKSVRYVNYTAVGTVISEINNMAKRAPIIDAVALPLIGAGLANGDWAVISEIIEATAHDFRPVVYLHDTIPAGIEVELAA